MQAFITNIKNWVLFLPVLVRIYMAMERGENGVKVRHLTNWEYHKAIRLGEYFDGWHNSDHTVILIDRRI